MNIIMDVIGISELDGFISKKVIPFVVCVPKDEKVSKKQQACLDKYYDLVMDKRGWPSYYCNIVNAYKCNDMGYKNIKFSDGREETIKNYSLERNESIENKYLVTSHFNSGNAMNSLELVKLIRLKVEDVKKEINE